MTTTNSSARSASRIRVLSATECAGFSLSMSIARKRLGWSVRISSGITLAGIMPPMMRCPPTGLVCDDSAPPNIPVRLVPAFMPPAFADISGHGEEKFLEVRVERAVQRLLDAEILVNRNARGASDSARHLANQSFVEACAPAVIRDRNVVQRCEQFIAVLSVLANVVVADQILLHEDRQESPRGRKRRCRDARADGSPPSRRSRCDADRSR